MKKILAFVLASIMVLSLVPASAFAAITKDCPDTHTLDNCKWAHVETVKPGCDEEKGFGYTIYECTACGEQFLANFVEPLAHTWKDNSNTSDRKNQTLNCKKKEDDIKFVKCSVCGKEEKQVTPWNQGHTPKYVTGFGCEALYECTTCGLEFYGLDKNNEPKLDAGHEWEFTKVEVEPVIKNGVVTPGSALYTCKGCKDTKSVQIVSPACKCDQGHQDVFTTRIVDYKANACGVEGTYAVYKCDDCNQLYKADKDGKILGKIKNIEEAKLPAKKHEAKADTTKKGNYDCEYTFTCKHCDQKITGYHHEKEKSYMVVTEYSVRDCVNYGYSVWLCNLCVDIL
jgi:DNA-directed RNA polymerase subunit RPC12/RpoP